MARGRKPKAPGTGAASSTPGGRQRLTLLLSDPTAERLRAHCRETGQELSAWVDRAVAAALDAQRIGTGYDDVRKIMRTKHITL